MLTIFLSVVNRVEILCHDISVHIPHHVSQKIPSYNLRLAHDSLIKNWGKVCTKFTSTPEVVSSCGGLLSLVAHENPKFCIM